MWYFASEQEMNGKSPGGLSLQIFTGTDFDFTDGNFFPIQTRYKMRCPHHGVVCHLPFDVRHPLG